jgi:hypothetical protein
MDQWVNRCLRVLVVHSVLRNGVAHPAKEHPGYMGTDKDGCVALCAGWRRVSPPWLWAQTKRAENRDYLDENPGDRLAGGYLLAKRRAKALRQPTPAV